MRSAIYAELEPAGIGVSVPVPRRTTTRLITAALAAWLLLIAAGVAALTEYSVRAGEQGITPAHWPAGSMITPIPGRDTLVMFVHPKCTCSRASLSELNEIMNAADGGAVSAFVVFLHPRGAEAGWDQTDSWASAARLPNTTRLVDREGMEADRFGALVSGHTVLYDARGTLLFSGGVTGSRGHAGDNVGRRTVLQLLAKNWSLPERHAVFGCPLRGPTDLGRRSP
ncbi:MAG: RedB protein [Polyangiaceae bacterium]